MQNREMEILSGEYLAIPAPQGALLSRSERQDQWKEVEMEPTDGFDRQVPISGPLHNGKG
jgi:hypothetical protein